MIILGIDPGIARVGWAILSVDKSIIKPVAYGCITTEKSLTPPVRLAQIFAATTKIIKKYHPDCLSVEDLFFGTNTTTAIGVGQSRGVILLTAAQADLEVISYSPPTVKRAITGNGRAEKTQVQHMVKNLLHLKEIPKPDDTADALAIALTHAYSYKMKGIT